jgi:drug/metabolite transporter (DMT)-like permease
VDYVYLICSVVCASTSSIFSRFFNSKNGDVKNASSLYSLLVCFAGLIGWGVLYASDFSFEPLVLLYSLGFGVSFVIVQTGIVNATKTGPVSLSALASQLSLIGTTIWGFIFWGDTPNAFSVVGILLVVVALWLCLGSNKKDEEKGVSFKWLTFAVMAFVGNMSCAIVQKSEQIAFNGEHGNQLMFFAMFFACIASYVLYSKNRCENEKNVLRNGYYPTVAGLCNVGLNFCIISMLQRGLATSLIYPTIAVGGLSLVSLFSVFVFKEKLSWKRWLGIAIGVLAIVLLSIAKEV